MRSDFLFVANWKMQLTYYQSTVFVRDNYDSLLEYAQHRTLVFCPSFDVITAVKAELKEAPIMLGAQDVSAYTNGAYTGQVSAQSLKEAGCVYCIVGHSERREYNYETDHLIAQKVAQLARVGITPIVCIGESLQQRQEVRTIDVLKKQLMLLVATIKKESIKQVCIAYEPLWAIGTGKIPRVDEIETILKEIKAYLAAQRVSAHVQLLYGGSVSHDNASTLMAIEGVNGFLIGGASIDFQKFKKIVS